MSSRSKANSSESENMCVVCFKTFEIHSIGICDHPVCFECSTRMRVLCRQNECPICRQDMPKVIFCTAVQPFRFLKAQYIHSQLVDRRYNIWFQNYDIQKAYNRLLEHNCTRCKKREPFRNFQQLKDHMRKEHELYYCDLCVLNLRIFTWERKCYTRQELAQHRRKGDVDDTSHRGHPLCEFCDTRYMDSDELYRHLRKEHLFCHFCDADGLHQYYSSYSSLRQHFEKEHYLCEEGECINEKFTSVFRTDIDLKAHKASVHSKHLGKAATKQARTLELEFTLAPRPRPESQANRGGRKPQSSSIPNDRLQDEGAVGYDQEYIEPSTSRGITLTAQDFPSLGGTPSISAAPIRPQTGNVTIRHITRGQQALARTDENFPALSDTGTVRFSVNSTVGSQDRIQSTTTASTPNVSIQVNHRPNGAITTHISQNTTNSVRVRPRADAFPALSSVTVPVPEAQWIKQPPKDPKPKVSKVAPAPVLPARNSPTDFPLLSAHRAEQKTKKSTSVTVPVTGSVSTSSAPSFTEQQESKKESNKNKKKKSKNLNSNNSFGTDSNSVQNKPPSAWEDRNTKKDTDKKDVKQNGVVKKRTELNIGNLHISDPGTSNGLEDFPVLGASKPPPGFTVHAPPGFAANDLTFTNSRGQSYSILPNNQFSPPPNFSHRNQQLVESFLSSVDLTDGITDFKQLSGLFRNGSMPADKYYEHCKEVMGAEFGKIFPELLALLPDIDKQQELYAIHCKNPANKRGLDVCATCKQVVTCNDLRNHLNTHTLQNHFPNLAPKEVPSVWRK